MVTYSDDSAERAEAVAFFHQLEHGLFPSFNLPSCIDALPFDESQKYLDEHPLQEQWSMLAVVDADQVIDDDLRRLQFVPELEVLKLITNKITDRGIEQIRWLMNLECLILYSTQVTNACLPHIVRLKSLRSVDMQCASRVSRTAYMDAMEQLPNLRPDRYPPFDAETVPVLDKTSFTPDAPW